MASSPLDLLSVKVCFLVAITSFQRVSELAAVVLILFFLLVERVLGPNVEFLPKVVSTFHKALVLTVFFPSSSASAEWPLHALDVRRALFFNSRKPNHLGNTITSFFHIRRTRESQ